MSVAIRVRIRQTDRQTDRVIITDVLWERVPEARCSMDKSSKAHVSQADRGYSEIDGGWASKGTGGGADQRDMEVLGHEESSK